MKRQPYSLEFSRPFHFGGQTLTERRGFHIILEGTKGSAVGDCAPFPEIGTEDANNALQALDTWAEKNLPCPAPSTDQETDLLLETLDETPAARFALEQALSQFQNRSLNISDDPQTVRTNALIGELPEAEGFEALEQCYRRGFSHVKMKVTPDSAEMIPGLLQKMKDQGHDLSGLRLDANGSFSPGDAALFLESIDDFSIDYVEDITENPEQMARLSRHHRVKLAMDRYAGSRQGRDALQKENRLAALILKPLQLGGIRPLQSYIDEYGDSMKMIISSAFESSIGLSYLYLAAVRTRLAGPHGLGVASLFRGGFPDLPSGPEFVWSTGHYMNFCESFLKK